MLVFLHKRLNFAAAKHQVYKKETRLTENANDSLHGTGGSVAVYIPLIARHLSYICNLSKTS